MRAFEMLELTAFRYENWSIKRSQGQLPGCCGTSSKALSLSEPPLWMWNTRSWTYSMIPINDLGDHGSLGVSGSDVGLWPWKGNILPQGESWESRILSQGSYVQYLELVPMSMWWSGVEGRTKQQGQRARSGPGRSQPGKRVPPSLRDKQLGFPFPNLLCLTWLLCLL